MGTELPLLLLLVAAALLIWQRQRSSALGRRRIRVDGAWRSYSIHRPRHAGPQKKLLLCFHGGLGRVDRLRRGSGILEAALQQGFIVIFPEAPEGWIDARPERGTSRRDLAFIEALLDRLRRTEGAAIKVYALGVSNGGMFVHRLAMEQPQRFAGFATLMAAIPAAAIRGQPAGPPAPIALVFGRDDRIMPWAGGRIAQGRRPGMGVGGTVISAEATLEYWLRRNHAQREPALRRTGGAGGPVEVRDYPAGPAGAPVRFVAIADWGHQWPRWPADDEGSDAFDVADVIFEFFAGPPGVAPEFEAEPVRLRLGGA